MSIMSPWGYPVLILSFLASFFYFLYLSRKENEKKLKGKDSKNKAFAEKTPSEYNQNQKIWALFIALFLLSVSGFTVYLYLNRKSLPIEATFLLPLFVFLIWYSLIKIGNRIK